MHETNSTASYVSVIYDPLGSGTERYEIFLVIDSGFYKYHKIFKFSSKDLAKVAGTTPIIWE